MFKFPKNIRDKITIKKYPEINPFNPSKKLLPFNKTAKQKTVKKRPKKLLDKRKFKGSNFKSLIDRFSIKTIKNKIVIWRINLILGLGKIFLSDNKPTQIISNKAIFKFIVITGWNMDIVIKKYKQPIIIGDLFSDPKILCEE